MTLMYVKVFRWVKAVGERGGSSRWEPLGSLKPPVRKVSFEGGLYDKVSYSPNVVTATVTFAIGLFVYEVRPRA